MSEFLKWYNLKNNRCPRCSKYLEFQGKFLYCPNCQFKIGKEKAQEISMSEAVKNLEQEDSELEKDYNEP